MSVETYDPSVDVRAQRKADGDPWWYAWHQCGRCHEWYSHVDGQGTTGPESNIIIICGKCFAEISSGTATRPAQPRQAIDLDVPALYAAAQITDFKPTHQGRPIRAQIAAWPFTSKFVLVQGVPGAGKTYATWAVDNGMARRGYRTLHKGVNELGAAWWSSMHKDREESALFNAAYLILDDLSSAPAFDGFKAMIQRVLDERMPRLKPTLITTAAGLLELETLYGPAIKSRLGASQFTWITLPAVDRRKEQR